MSRPTLEVPLTREQVTAANELYQRHLPDWQRCDGILHALRDHFPSNTDLECVLPKAVTLNQLYATRVFAIARMADHIVRVLSQEAASGDISLVERIAWLPDVGPSGTHFRSFASKYCHFFVCPDRFPIFDTFAGDALDYHLGPHGRAHCRQGPFSYLTYVADIDCLRATLHPTPSYVELDRYLWLRGQWLAAEKAKQAGKEPHINAEARGLFEMTAPAAADLLRQAFGEDG